MAIAKLEVGSREPGHGMCSTLTELQMQLVGQCSLDAALQGVDVRVGQRARSVKRHLGSNKSFGGAPSDAPVHRAVIDSVAFALSLSLGMPEVVDLRGELPVRDDRDDPKRGASPT